MERIVEVVKGSKPLTIFAKHSILDVWQVSQYVSVTYLWQSPIIIPLTVHNEVRIQTKLRCWKYSNLFSIPRLSIILSYTKLLQVYRYTEVEIASKENKELMFTRRSQRYIKCTQLTFTCSNSTTETLEKGVKYVKVNNKNPWTGSLTSFWCFYR